MRELKTNMETASEEQLKTHQFMIAEELEKRKNWPKRLVFMVDRGNGGMERFLDLSEALEAFAEAVEKDLRNELRLNRDWTNDVTFKWKNEKHNPEKP